MPSSLHIFEVVFRCLPEVVCFATFWYRRKYIDTRPAEELLHSFDISDASIEDQRAELLDLVDWEMLKRDWEAALLSCGLSYVVLAVVAPKVWIGVGFAVWIGASSLLKLIIREGGSRERARSRTILIRAFALIIFVSCLAKIATVLGP